MCNLNFYWMVKNEPLKEWSHLKPSLNYAISMEEY